jgi:hypothetical protein
MLLSNINFLNSEPKFGAAGTPYENGVFQMKLLLSCDFPWSPPKSYYLSKVSESSILHSVPALKKPVTTKVVAFPINRRILLDKNLPSKHSNYW